RPQRCFRRRHWRESDRVIRPMKPGNAGGGKDPDFWRAFEDGEVKVIGKSLQTPTRIRILQRKLYRKAKAEPAYGPASAGAFEFCGLCGHTPAVSAGTVLERRFHWPQWSLSL